MKAIVPLAELVEDLDLYPRHAVDPTNVASLSLALESGAELPPIVADSKSKRIVDGWHRARAFKRVHGAGATVPVEWRKYKTEADLVEDAVRLNATHGRKLDAIDQTRAVLMLERLGVPLARIALTMHIPETRIEKLSCRVAQSKVQTSQTVPHTKTITLKRSVSHMAGKTLTKEQANAHKGMPGTSFLLVARQLKTAILTGMLNTEDQRLMTELGELSAALRQIL